METESYFETDSHSGFPFFHAESEFVRKEYEAAAPRFGLVGQSARQMGNLPFDTAPRIIGHDEFARLEEGLIQRVNALNMYLADIYSAARILRDGAVPKEFALSSSGFIPRLVDITPRGGIYAHIAGIDLVKGKDKKWYVLEDNLRVPSGASFPLAARRAYLTARTDLGFVEDSFCYGDMLKECFDHVSSGGISAILTPGSDNCAFFDHCALAELTGSALCESDDLFVEDDVLYFKGAEKTERVGTLYMRLDPVYSDPLFFRSDSAIGVAGLFAAYRGGNVAVVNAYGCGAADDKGLYAYVPDMIKYYLGQQPILSTPPTFLPTRESDRKFILDNLKRLVVKKVDGSGGKDIVFGEGLSRSALEELKREIDTFPRRYIAQEVVDFESLPVENGERKADLRAFVVTGKTTRVWKSGLTRYATDEDAFIVNSSSGGGFKDTWVLSR